MEAKEKAQEIYDKINRCIPIEASFSDTAKRASDKMLRDHLSTIEIAGILVDEIFNSDPLSPSTFNHAIAKADAYKNCESDASEYWQKVKEEINKL